MKTDTSLETQEYPCPLTITSTFQQKSGSYVSKSFGCPLSVSSHGDRMYNIARRALNYRGPGSNPTPFDDLRTYLVIIDYEDDPLNATPLVEIDLQFRNLELSFGVNSLVNRIAFGFAPYESYFHILRRKAITAFNVREATSNDLVAAIVLPDPFVLVRSVTLRFDWAPRFKIEHAWSNPDYMRGF